MDDPAEDAKWRVLLLNDDITPMEFVVCVIRALCGDRGRELPYAELQRTRHHF